MTDPTWGDVPRRAAIAGGAAAALGLGGNGPAPLNAPPAGVPQIGVQPGGLQGAFIGRLAIIFGTGPSTGLFVYNGTPALGNAPLLAITTASHDPYGNTVTPATITDGGMPLLIYNGAPAAGNLTSSVASSGATDSFGNQWQQGLVSYVPPGTTFAQLLSGVLNLLNPAATWTVSLTSAGVFSINHSQTNDTVFVKDTGLGTNTAALVGSTPGTPNTPETWHNLALVGGVWTSSVQPRYRMEPVGSGSVVRLDGIVTAAAANAAGTAISTLAAGWRPAANKSIATVGPVAGFGGVSVSTAGVITINNACPNGDSYALDGATFPLD